MCYVSLSYCFGYLFLFSPYWLHVLTGAGLLILATFMDRLKMIIVNYFFCMSGGRRSWWKGKGVGLHSKVNAFFFFFCSFIFPHYIMYLAFFVDNFICAHESMFKQKSWISFTLKCFLFNRKIHLQVFINYWQKAIFWSVTDKKLY